jgi:hypothetical protein
MQASEPVTSGSSPGGRPRRKPAPDTPFTRWLSASKLTVREVAEKLGLTNWAVYNLRSGHHKPSLEVAVAIADMSDGAVPADSWGEQRRTKARGKLARAKRKSGTK